MPGMSAGEHAILVVDQHSANAINPLAVFHLPMFVLVETVTVKGSKHTVCAARFAGYPIEDPRKIERVPPNYQR